MVTKFQHLPNDIDFKIAVSSDKYYWKLAIIECAYQLKRIADKLSKKDKG